MKELKYIGRLSGVDIDGIGTVKRGETAKAPDKLADELLERHSEWELARKKKESKPKEKR